MTTKTVDHHGPGQQLDPGDLIATARAIYRVDAVREVESRQWPERWRYTVTKVATRENLAEWSQTDEFTDGARMISTTTYGPGERPGQPRFQACGHPDCEGCP